jgi:hypothetical protein
MDLLLTALLRRTENIWTHVSQGNIESTIDQWKIPVLALIQENWDLINTNSDKGTI